MTFDIIDIGEQEAESLPSVKLKLLRTAQQKKNELYHKLQQQIAEYRRITLSNNVFDSTLCGAVEKELTEEYEYQVDILREQLEFNMALGEPTTGGETGDSGNDDSGYLVDYELSYIERYIQVRDFYLAIENPDERLALLASDDVAKEYLGSYYTTMIDYFASLANDGT